MSPDSLETRVARLEQRLEDTIVRMDARLMDLATDVRALSPLVIAHAEMAVKLTIAVEEAKAAHKAVDALESHLSERDEALQTQLSKREEVQREEREEQRKERKRDRQWLVGVVFAAAMMIIAAIGLLLG